MSSCRVDVQSRHPDLVSPSETGLGCEDRRGPVLEAKGLCPQGHPWRQEKAGDQAWGQAGGAALVRGHTGGSAWMVSPPAHIRGATGRRLGLTPRAAGPAPARRGLRAPHPGQASPSSCWRPASGWGPGAEPGPPAGARAGLRPTSCQAPEQRGEIGSRPSGRRAGARSTAPPLSCPTGVPATCWRPGNVWGPCPDPTELGSPTSSAVSWASPASSCTWVSLSPR